LPKNFGRHAKIQAKLGDFLRFLKEIANFRSFFAKKHAKCNKKAKFGKLFDTKSKFKENQGFSQITSQLLKTYKNCSHSRAIYQGLQAFDGPFPLPVEHFRFL
jgi:hypothetical protein